MLKYWSLSFLKELGNYNRKLFLCPPKKYAETQPTLYTAIFQRKFILGTSKQISTLFDLLFSRKPKKTHTDQSILQAFSLCLKRNVS